MEYGKVKKNRQSPYTSSDILATLMFDFKPEERGLQQTDGRPIWTFSADYIDRLRRALARVQRTLPTGPLDRGSQ